MNGGNSPSGTIYTISPTQYNKVALAIVNRPDFPATSDLCGRIIWGIPLWSTTTWPSSRNDYQWTPKHTLFGRYLLDSSKGGPYSLTKNLLSVSGNNTNAMANAFTLGQHLLDQFQYGECPSVNGHSLEPPRITRVRCFF